ncbi:MAG: DNA-3-methyladenine glycosylase I [Alphaproteobacteria bacterium]|nr:DNA-3-methyladenine glycosylase I [Alphaproteobacteria bacterium]
MAEESLITGKDGHTRCWWCGDDPLYIRYHDEEWGNPVYDDVRLFEKICLEGFQAGLSWLTILRKRENFRTAFAGFDFYEIAGFDENKVLSLLQDHGIIRHRGKIEATINNAKRAIEFIEEHGTLSDYFWSFSPEKDTYTDTYTAPLCRTDMPPHSPASQALSKDLKHRGWRFVGPTTCYAFMQAMGLVNDHIKGCRFR